MIDHDRVKHWTSLWVSMVMEFINDDDICRRQWRNGKRQKDRGEPGTYPLEGVIIQLVNTQEREDKTSQLTQRTK